jgi:hypothetical protein
MLFCEREYSNMLEIFQYILAKSKEHSCTHYFDMYKIHFDIFDVKKKIEYYLIDPNISMH